MGGVLAIVGGHYVQDPTFACYGPTALAGRPLNVFSNFQTNGGKHLAGTLVLLRVDARASPAGPSVCVRQFNPTLEKYDVTEPERCFQSPALAGPR